MIESRKIDQISIGVLAFSAALFSLFLLSGSPVLPAVLIAVLPWAFFLLFFFPHILLFTLLFIRPALDRLSEIFSFPLPFDPDRFITIAQAFGLLTVLLGALFFIPRVKTFLRIPLFLPFSIMLIWGTGTLLYSIDAAQTAYELLRLFSIMFIFLLAYSVIRSEKRFFRLVIVSAFSAIIPITVAIYQFIFGIGYTDSSFSVPRIYGTFAHPNIFALYLVTILALLLMLFFTHPKERIRNISIGAFFSVFAILVATYARAAWGTFFAFLGMLGIVKYPKILPFLIVLPIALFLLSTTVQERVADAVSFSPAGSLAWRITIWGDTIHQTVADQKVLLGHGLGTFEEVAENLRGIRFVVNDPHSEFVRSFVEGGVVGLSVLLLFSAAPVILFWRLWRKNKTNRSGDIFLVLLCLWLSLLLLSFTDHVLRSTMVQWILWAVIGGALRVYTGNKQIKRSI